MGFFHLLWSLVVGFFVGLIARAIVPGVDRIGVILTIVLGIVGSLVGGFLGGLIFRSPAGSRFHAAGFLLSIVGAVVVLLLWRLLRH